MAMPMAVSCDLHNGLSNSTEQKVCVNPDGEKGKIGKSVEYAIISKEQNERFCGNRF